jgi:hypothetical protein
MIELRILGEKKYFALFFWHMSDEWPMTTFGDERLRHSDSTISGLRHSYHLKLKIQCLFLREEKKKVVRGTDVEHIFKKKLFARHEQKL